MNKKIRPILKLVAALFLISAIMNYSILLALPKINYYWTLQYVGALFNLIYFISAVLVFYAAFWQKNRVFLYAYVFAVSSFGLASPAFPIPVSLFPDDPCGAFWVYGFDLLVLLLVVFLQLRDRNQRRTEEAVNRAT